MEFFLFLTDPFPYRATIGDEFQAIVGDYRAGFQIDGGQLGTVITDRLRGYIGDLLTLGQVQLFNIVAVFG